MPYSFEDTFSTINTNINASDSTSPNHSSGRSGNTEPRDRQELESIASDGSAVASPIFGPSCRRPGEGRPETGSNSADNP